eukprot:TRINITY_DN1472_c0_g1_i1.p1 TRINITY_DN1472_c0_g1~~TRINITY_DN1472_c0_g1_i1.p1  ORF type:complete len:329 (+),score=53.00 TRINITY_DN1472_c0_g1_i1:60-1046(+)
MDTNQNFIQDVISFIDAPLSPSSLNKLKKSCRGQGYEAAITEGQGAGQSPAQIPPPPVQPSMYASPAGGGESAYSSLTYLYPVGCEVEAQHLHNTTEFNGMRGTVTGHQDGKLLVEFYGYAGQTFDIPTFNVKVVGPGTSTTRGPSLGVPAPAPNPVLPVNPAMPVYSSPSMSTHTANLLEVNSLKDKLRMSLTHVEVARDALTHASMLDVVSHEDLISVIGELQPTLSRQNISKNWRKIVQIYMAHAEKVSLGMVGREAGYAGAPAPAASPAPAAQYDSQYSSPMDLAGNLESVINFIDQPLSPRTLREVRQVRHSLSPRRGRSGSQ